MGTENLVTAVKDHALAHYEEDGWDIVIETMEDHEIAKIIHGCKSVGGAIRRVKAYIKPVAGYRNEIQNA